MKAENPFGLPDDIAATLVPMGEPLAASSASVGDCPAPCCNPSFPITFLSPLYDPPLHPDTAAEIDAMWKRYWSVEEVERRRQEFAPWVPAEESQDFARKVRAEREKKRQEEEGYQRWQRSLKGVER